MILVTPSGCRLCLILRPDILSSSTHLKGPGIVSTWKRIFEVSDPNKSKVVGDILPDKKLPNIIPVLEDTMKLSARNMLKGTIKQIITGAVNSEVIIETSGGETIVSIITRESVKSLDLKEGREVYAVIKASNVMVAVD